MITDLFMQQLVAGGRSKQRQSHVHPHQHARRRPLRGNGSRVCSTNRRMKFVKSTMNNCFWSFYDAREAFFHWPGDRKGEPSFSLNRCHVGRRASPHGNLRLPPSLAGHVQGALSPSPLPECPPSGLQKIGPGMQSSGRRVRGAGPAMPRPPAPPPQALLAQRSRAMPQRPGGTPPFS